MRQAGLKPKSHSSGVYWVRANASPNGSKTNTANEPTGIFDIILWCIFIPIILVSLPLFLLYEFYRMISDRG
jgi:hypothetical protein